MSKFDDVARTWDENPVHMERSMAIAAKIDEMLPLNRQMKALEYGFMNIVFEVCFSMQRILADGSSKSFPIFLIVASK